MKKSLKEKAVVYARTSSLQNVSDDKDSLKRQKRSTNEYAKKNKIEIVEHFYDAAVSGSSEIKNRKELTKCLNYCIENEIKIVLVESAHRFSNDVIVQEILYKLFADKNIEIVPVDNQVFTDKSMRRLFGVMTEYQKDIVVNRLAVARESKAENNYKNKIRTLQKKPKICGTKPYYIEKYPDIEKIIKMLMRHPNKKKMSLQQISNHLYSQYNVTNQNNKPLSRAQISRINNYADERNKN